MSFASRLEARLEPWMSADLKRYVKAVAAMFEPVETLAIESGEDGATGYVPPYGGLFNPNTVTLAGMRYLAQYVGVTIPVGASESEARAVLKAESGQARGTRASLEALLKKALGEVPFYILEREPTPYSLVIVIPVGHLSEAVYQEANRTIPAGINWSVVERANTWYAGGKAWSAVKAGLKWSTPPVEGEY